jgi:AraC-like DNA-binding protein
VGGECAVSYDMIRKNRRMQRLSDLLALWTALAAVARDPGRIRVLPADGREAAGHWLHPVPTVVVALSGVARVDSPGRPAVDLLPGQALVIAPGAAHRHAPLRRQAATLELGFDYDWCDLEFHADRLVISATMQRQPAEGLVARMVEGDSAALRDLLALIIERPLQDLRQLPVAVQHMRDRIRSHGLTPITAADIARAGGLRPSRAWQAFRAHFGCTPRQALERRRCAVAAALLAQGLAVGVVAQRCGFMDRGTFTRAFVRVHGHTPGRHAV